MAGDGRGLECMECGFTIQWAGTDQPGPVELRLMRAHIETHIIALPDEVERWLYQEGTK